MAELFGVDRTRITRHISSIIANNEIEVQSNVRKAHFTHAPRPISLYSLDMILAVGYRINSKRGVIFRRWANMVLKQYLLEVYVFNQKRLAILNRIFFIILLFWCWKSILSVAWGKPRGLSKRRQLRRFYF